MMNCAEICTSVIYIALLTHNFHLQNSGLNKTSPTVGRKMEQLQYVGVHFTTSCNKCDSCNYNSTPHDYGLCWKLAIIFGSLGAISVVTCAIAVVLFLCNLRLLRLFTYRMALYQVISAMFFSFVAMSSFQQLANVQDQHESQQLVLNATCIAAGFLLQYSNGIKLLLTTTTTFHLFLLIVFNWNLQKKYGTKLEVGYIGFSLVFPLLFIWVPFIHSTVTYGKAGGAWCWIVSTNPTDAVIDQFAFWYIPLTILLLFNTIMIVVTILILVSCSTHTCCYKHNDPVQKPILVNADVGTKQKTQLLKISLPLLAYPIVYQILSIFAIANRLYNVVNGHFLLGLWIAHALSSGSRGFFAGVTLIIHLCMVKFNRPGHKKHKVAKQVCGARHVTYDSNDIEDLDTAVGRVRAMTNVVTSAMKNTTDHPVPPESEADRAFLQQKQSHRKSFLKANKQQLMYNSLKTSTSHDGTLSTTGDMYNTPSSAHKKIKKRKLSVKGASVVATTQDIATAIHQEEQNIAKQHLVSNDKGYACDAELTSDEDITSSWKVPPESTVDKAILQHKNM